MKEKTKTALNRIPLICAGIAYATSGLDLISGQDKILFGIFFLIIAVLNILAVLFIIKLPGQTNGIINILNAVAAVVYSYLTYQSGSPRMPYVYILIAVLFLIASILNFKRLKFFGNSPG